MRRRTEPEPPPAEPVALGRISGRVTQRPGDAPVAGCTVCLLSPFTADDLPLGEAQSADDGSFAFDGVPAGAARVVAIATIDGAPRRAVETVRITAGATEDLEIRLSSARVEPIEVRGRVVWSDTEEPVAGFRFELHPDGEGDRVPVIGSDGVFRARVPRAGIWYIVSAASDEGPQEHLFVKVVAGSDAEAVVRFHRAGDAVLRVVDADTRAPLGTARAHKLRRSRGWSHFEPGHLLPSRETQAGPARRADAAGVIALGSGQATSEWFVTADGHEWLAVLADHSSAEPQEVRLRAAGSLRLEIARWKELDAPLVDIDAEDHGRMGVPPPDDTGVVVVDGLLPGRRNVVVRRGKWFEHGVVYGSADVEVVAGTQARLALDVDPGERREKVDVTGTLNVPAAWGRWPRVISLEGGGEENAEYDESEFPEAPASGRKVTFRFEDVPTGGYLLEVDPFQWRREVVVGPAPTHWDLDLGAPAEVVVTVLDDATGAPMAGAELSWYTLLPGQSSWSPERAEPRPDAPGTFAFFAPPGVVHLGASAPGCVDAASEVEAAAEARAEVTLRLGRGGTIRVRLLAGGKPFLVAEPMVSVSPADQDFASTWSRASSVSGGVGTLENLEPGTYVVSVYDVPGWTTTTDRVVLRAGETVDVVLNFERRP